ncbi:MAG: K(+)-transporting ATPase subunit F [Bacteroidota bacterium]
MLALMLFIKPDSFYSESSSAGYIIGAVVALLIFGYLLYALVNPEKF